MCHSDDSRPPAAPRAGAVASATGIQLESADGTRFMGFEALPAEPTGKGAVILPDFRGLHAFYEDLARRLAEVGFAAIAIDYFGRALPDDERNHPPQEMFPLLLQLTPEQVAADVRAASDRLRASGVERVFSVGFCYGGSQSWNQSAFDHGLAGCVGFYGKPDDCRPYLERMRVPLLRLVAGADSMTPLEESERFDAELGGAGVEHETVVYEGAPHGFFDADLGFEEACADAWRQLLRFTSERAGSAA